MLTKENTSKKIRYHVDLIKKQQSVVDNEAYLLFPAVLVS